MRSTREDIIDAAMACFARDGFGVALRPIAEAAGVSAALIVHHFGSKAGLREAVDDHVLGVATEKLRVLDDDGPAAAIALVVRLVQDGTLPRYLARVIVEGDASGKRLFEAFVDVTEKALVDLDLPERRVTAALLVTHSLGLMMMTDHVKAATGIDPFRGENVHRFITAALAIYGGDLRPLLPS